MDPQDILRLDNIWEYCDLFNQPASHPLVGVIDFSKSKPCRHQRHLFNFYVLFLKEVKCGDLIYGRHTYDYQEGTVVAIAPGQIAGCVDDGTTFQPKGYALLFHPDLIHGTQLARQMKAYTYFSYESREALHLSEKERETYMQCLKKIQEETQAPIDRHTRKIIVATLEVLLDHLLRFYERQFQTRAAANHDVLTRFEQLLTEYYDNTTVQQRDGLPTVKYFADHLFLSANYFGDLVKKETGQSPRDYIQRKIIDVAKERVLNPSSNISNVAYELGFRYPQHFTRLFKKVTGQTPQQYRQGLA